MNWRKPLILALLSLSGSKVTEHLKQIREYEYAGREELEEMQRDKLRTLLIHAYEQVPYYHKILPECGVVRNGNVVLEHFSRIPIPTKDIIRKTKILMGKSCNVDFEYVEDISRTASGKYVYTICKVE